VRLFEIGAYRSAVKEYETVLSMKGLPKKQREEAEYFLARSHHAMRKWPAAIEGFQAYLKRYPSGKYSAETLFYLGKASLREGKDEAYLQAHLRYLKKYPDGDRRCEILYRLALFYRDRGDENRAVALLDEIMESDSLGEWVARALWEKGWMAYRKGDYPDAVTRWQPLTRRPDLGMASQALYWQGRSYEKRGMADKADELFQSLCDSYPYSYYCVLAGYFREAVPEHEDLSPADAPSLSDPEVPVLKHPRYRRLEAMIQVDLLPVQTALEARLLEREYRHDKPSLLILADILTQMGDIPRVIGILQNHFPGEITRGGIETARFWEMVYPTPYDRVIRFYAGHYGVDPALVWAMIREESWFNPEARSTAGALGLMQLMPDTAQILEPKTVPFPDDDGPSILEEDQGGLSDTPDLFAPERNIALGVHFLSDLLVRFDGETVLAVAAYNAGPGAVARWTREIRTDEIDEFVEAIPYPETRRYVKRVIRSYAEYQRVGTLTGERQKQYSHAQDP
jgi:soluble lytic murein transglycosylase